MKSAKKAKELSDKVWKIIDDSSKYSFNASHSYCYAIDSLYCAWLKANYPYEFYETQLKIYTEKGNKDKVALFKFEMFKYFGIREGEYKYGLDNTEFKADKENKTIYPQISSLKFMNNSTATSLLKISKTICDEIGSQKPGTTSR